LLGVRPGGLRVTIKTLLSGLPLSSAVNCSESRVSFYFPAVSPTFQSLRQNPRYIHRSYLKIAASRT